MADIQINPAGNIRQPDIVGAVSTGFGIAQGRASQQLQREKFEQDKITVATEQQRLEEVRKDAKNDRMFTDSITMMKISKSRNDAALGMEGLKMMYRSQGVSDAVLNSENFELTQKQIDDAIDIANTKDPAEEEMKTNMFLEDYKINLSNFLAKESGKFAGLESAEKKIAEREKREAIAGVLPEGAKPLAEAGVSVSDIAKLTPEAPEIKTEFIKRKSATKKGEKGGMVDIVLVNKATGKDIKTVGKLRQFKPEAGKPFKQDQMILYKLDESGNLEAVEGLNIVDGSVNVGKLNKFIGEGFVTEEFLRSKNPTLIDTLKSVLDEKEETPVKKKEVTKRSLAVQRGKSAGRKERFDAIKAVNPMATKDQIESFMDFEEKAISIKEGK